jgi:hypothetical protein
MIITAKKVANIAAPIVARDDLLAFVVVGREAVVLTVSV